MCFRKARIGWHLQLGEGVPRTWLTWTFCVIYTLAIMPLKHRTSLFSTWWMERISHHHSTSRFLSEIWKKVLEFSIRCRITSLVVLLATATHEKHCYKKFLRSQVLAESNNYSIWIRYMVPYLIAFEHVTPLINREVLNLIYACRNCKFLMATLCYFGLQHPSAWTP